MRAWPPNVGFAAATLATWTTAMGRPRSPEPRYQQAAMHPTAALRSRPAAMHRHLTLKFVRWSSARWRPSISALGVGRLHFVSSKWLAVIDRRTSMGGVAIAAALFLALSLVVTAYAWAQQPAKLPKVAVLSPIKPTAEPCGPNLPSLPCFLDAMRELGYVDGKSVSYEFRFAEGDERKLLSLATELVSLRPDVIYTVGPGATAAANATTTIPIIVGPGGEEALTRLAGKLAHPTGNVTGFPLTSVEQLLKCLQYLKELAPRASRVAFLVNLDDPGSRDYPSVLASAAAQLGVTLVRIEARNVSDLPQAFTAIAASGANAIFLLDDPVLAGTSEARREVIERAWSRGLPLASTNSGVASEGGLVSFGTDRPALARRAASYVDKILKGVKPADLPVERPSTFKLSINVKTAKALGLTVPHTMLIRADEVIQ
jgi:ABC-type uncharacterized transport system substrate-binding protein